MADIVERLRSGAAHQTLVTTGLVNQAADLITALRAENERLKAELEELDFLRHEGGSESIAALEAENERLRAALVEIVKPGGADGFWECFEIARSALEEKQ